MSPASGHWKNNPNADDIDFQIETDSVGLMTPGMINASSRGYQLNLGSLIVYSDTDP